MPVTVLQLDRPQTHQNPSVTNVTSPFEKGRLFISGFAAIGILMTLFQ